MRTAALPGMSVLRERTGPPDAAAGRLPPEMVAQKMILDLFLIFGNRSAKMAQNFPEVAHA